MSMLKSQSAPLQPPITPLSIEAASKAVSHTLSLSHVMSNPGAVTLLNGLPAMPTLRDGEGGGGIPIPHGALSSPDTLSDTKIFVLLASVVFIFLIALGVGMARVSHTRRQQEEEQIAQQIITAQRPPETLNKTILDILPVFEVTERRQLRRLHVQPRRDIFNECTSNEYARCNSSHPAPRLVCTEGGCSHPEFVGQHVAQYRPAEVALEKASRHSLCMPYCGEPDIVSLHDTPQLPTHAPRCSLHQEVSGGSVCMFDKASRELTPMLANSTSRSSSPPPHCMVPAPRRYYHHGSRRNDIVDVYPLPISARHSHMGCRWDEATPVSNRAASVDPGIIVYDDRRSRSLDLTPEREPTVGFACTGDPLPDWLLSTKSHPEITRKPTEQSSSSIDGNEDDGLGACPICLEEFSVGDHLRELPCLHKYHVICIDTWLVSRSTCCPYCKMDIRRWFYGPEFQGEIPRSGPLSSSNHPLDFHGLPPSRRGSIGSMLGQDARPPASRLARIRRTMRSANSAFEP